MQSVILLKIIACDMRYKFYIGIHIQQILRLFICFVLYCAQGCDRQNMNENVEKKPPKINLKQADWMIKRAEFSLVDLKHSHLLVSPNSQGRQDKV